ncbi:MAG: hypothetical protein ACRDGI_05400 [Candidatus Limnocylindrales bacterium]
MTEPAEDRFDEPILELVGPGERLQAMAKAADYRILVTDARVAVAQDSRVALDIPIVALRRIQFDIEKSRPATLVFVPESPQHPPQVLVVPVEHYPEVAAVLAKLGELLAG